MQAGPAAVAVGLKQDFKVCCRHKGRAFVRPFDQANTLVAEVLLKACIDKFFRVREPIKIKVIQV